MSYYPNMKKESLRLKIRKLLSAPEISDVPFFKIVLLGGAALALFAFFQREKLPPKWEVLPELFRDPVQQETEIQRFVRTRGGIAYTITPLYSYELYGMIVSYAEAGHWADYYHKRWKDNLNVKDIAVIWGENIRDLDYQKVKFSSNAWQLNYDTPDRKVYYKIRNDKLSNNHLLSDKDGTNKLILNARKGDQIHIKGYLARYSHTNNTFTRGTSISRTDEGNGACETIFVREFKILKKANLGWRFVFPASLGVFFFSVFLMVSNYVLRVFFP